MIGSQSLVAAVGHAITLHSLNFLTLGLLLLWALSPLGGQSALRLLNETNTTMVGTHPVFYSSVDAQSAFATTSSYNQEAANQVDAVVKTTLMTVDTTDSSPMDIWQHPKIPRLAELEAAEEKNENDRPWYSIDHSVNHTYAALTGLDVLNLPQSGSTNFTVPYEYMYFSCAMSPANNMSMNKTDPMFGQPFLPSQMNYLTGLQNASKLESGSYYNATGVYLKPYPGPLFGPIERSFFIYTKMANVTKPESLIFGSKSIGTTYYLFECSMKSVMVEAAIRCESSNCGVDKLRRLNKPRADRPSTIALPYDVINNGQTNKYFVTHFIEMGGQTRNNVANPIDQYIYGLKPWGKSEIGSFSPPNNWTTYVVEPQKSVAMSNRLTMFLNTYWDASRWPQSIARNDPYGLVSVNRTTGLPPATLTMNQTEATTMQQKPIYKANATWVAILVICSCILLLLGIFSLVISLMTTVPDIFDYVSSFTRDNPFVNAPKGGSSIDGAQRARLLRKLPIQLGDTDPAGEVGYIAIRSVNSNKDRVAGRVRKARMYI